MENGLNDEDLLGSGIGIDLLIHHEEERGKE